MVSRRLSGGLGALEMEGGQFVEHDPIGNPSTEVAVEQDGDLRVLSHWILGFRVAGSPGSQARLTSSIY